jgi:hypothetical protein
MLLPLKKFKQRLLLLSLSTAYNLIPLAFNVIIAALVVRILNASLWGGMVQVLVWTGIAGNIMSWGNKDYLIRSFSADTSSISKKWHKSFGTRSLIFLIIILLIIPVPADLIVKSWVALYLTARFLYQSYEPVIVFRRNFIASILIESAGFLLIGAGIIYFQPAELSSLLCWFVLAEVLKAAGIVWLYRKELLPLFFRNFEAGYLSTAFSFFLLYFTGMLASRIDVLAASYLLSKEAIAKYQVLISFVLATQLMIPILLLPYVSIIYRMSLQSIRKMALRLLIVGMLLSCVSVFAISMILEFVYQFTYAPVTFLLAWLIAVPGFYYSPLIYRLFKNNQQHLVVCVALIFICCSAILIALFVFLVPDTFNAVLTAMAVVQWLQAITYFIIGRKLR